MTNATLRGKPDAGNPHVRFDEGEVASAKPRRGSLLYKGLGRRDFLKGSAAFGLAAGAGCMGAPRAGGFVAQGDIRAFLLHLGHNMWNDYLPEDMDQSILKDPTRDFEDGAVDLTLRCKADVWRRTTDYLAANGLNMLVIDLGEGLQYPSHPELAIKGSWSPDKMRDEIARLNACGIEVIPKLNFSTAHNGWMKHYRRMVSTTHYYRFCEDVIADVAEIFGTPRFFHIGCDEETAYHQSIFRFVALRRGELWQHDFLHLVRTVERNGMRPWAWSDYGWEHPDFFTWCPRSVLQSNWYYDECYGGFELAKNKTADYPRLKCFYELDKAGFDQVPCGTNWVGSERVQQKVGADDVIGKLVTVCRRDISAARLKGFLMAPWAPCDNAENELLNRRGVDLFAAALKGGR